MYFRRPFISTGISEPDFSFISVGHAEIREQSC